MYEKKNGTLSPNRMLWVYSAHDMTIANLLNAFELYEHLLVPYAAVLMIELRLNTTGNYVVTVSFAHINIKYVGAIMYNIYKYIYKFSTYI